MNASDEPKHLPGSVAKTMTNYQREDELKSRINLFLESSFGLPKDDYYSRLDLHGLLQFKSALSGVNNTLTLRLTLGFIDWVAQALSLVESDRQRLREGVLSSKPNSNGYDVQFDMPPFIAEVKCNVPINGGNTYGSNQKHGVLKDVRGLLEGKNKAQDIPVNALKFMVFLDLPAVRSANENLLENDPNLSNQLVPILEGTPPSDPDVVYVVYAMLGA